MTEPKNISEALYDKARLVAQGYKGGVIGLFNNSMWPFRLGDSKPRKKKCFILFYFIF